MAETITNKARVGDAFDLLARGLEPYVARQMRRVTKADDWAAAFVKGSRDPRQQYSTSDPSFLLNVMIEAWPGAFERALPRSTRNLLFTLRDKRNEWAHNRAIQLHDAQFTLSGIVTLLEVIDAKEADEARISLDQLNYAVFEKAKQRIQEQGTASNVLDAPKGGLKPWREVVEPHADVIGGTFSVAEFAADLELVRKGVGAAEYTDPALFFERTYLTVGLRDLLELAVRRIAGHASQPVINCQTSFGGGKTHSLIALWHLFSGLPLDRLPVDVRDLVAAAGVAELPSVRRAVVVGNRFGAGESHAKPDGTVVRTIWGEIAWQLGGADGYAVIADSDHSGTNPGDKIRTVIEQAAPCLILIDEWVAYARELYGRDDLSGGTFDSQFGFAQTLTEAVSGTPGAMFVVSIPASEGSSAGDDSTTSIEVGGAAGMEALRRLTAVVSRKAEHWKPASSDESFEIVRRRLFQPVPEDRLADRDAVAEAFGELYRTQRSEFPSECAEVAYVERLRRAYPIHPEVFDRLYEDWSTVERFQRTRGVLRLMATVTSSLWESEDRSPLILPCSIPLADARVNGELAGKLPEHWAPVIDADVDGPSSRAAEIDRAVPALGSHHATRRVARTIFLAATPNVRAVNRGVEVDRIRLGSVFAGERPGFVADALNRLAAQAPYLYVDRDRYWFDVHQNVNRTAREDAERLLAGDKHEVRDEIVRRLRLERAAGDFRGVHVAPPTSDTVADDAACRLVVLGPDAPHIAKAEESPAKVAAREILDRRGTSPRQYRNMLVFAAADQRALEGLEQAVAEHLAWSSISERSAELNLDAHQQTQAANRRKQSDDAVSLRLAEAYQYALVPRQDDPVGAITLEVSKLDSQGTVGQRASRRLTTDGDLQVQFPPVMLRLRLDGPLATRWEDGHVTVAALWEDFARYVYLPRLRDLDVLVATATNGPATITWQSEGFATAAAIDDVTGRYRGLVMGEHPAAIAPTSLLVRPDFALGQAEADEGTDVAGTGAAEASGRNGETVSERDGARPSVTTFRGTKHLDPERPVPDFNKVAAEVLQHFAGLAGADVEISVHVRAVKPDGFDDAIVRTVTENANYLKFQPGSGFSED
jgi:predicted AAA+ superfamily ATPase